MRVSVDIILGFVPSDCGCVSSLLAVSVTFFGCLRDLVLAVDSRVLPVAAAGCNKDEVGSEELC